MIVVYLFVTVVFGFETFFCITILFCWLGVVGWSGWFYLFCFI